jgi:hypothetical protein
LRCPASGRRRCRMQPPALLLEGEEVERIDASQDGVIRLQLPDNRIEDLEGLKIEQLLSLYCDQDHDP